MFATWEGLQCLLSEPALHPNVSTADAFDQHRQTFPQPDPLPVCLFALPCPSHLIEMFSGQLMDGAAAVVVVKATW